MFDKQDLIHKLSKNKTKIVNQSLNDFDSKRLKKNLEKLMKNKDKPISEKYFPKSQSLIEFNKKNFLEKDSKEFRSEYQDEIISINVSGTIFQSYLSTLERYPDSLLGKKIERDKYKNKRTNEYFFDRNRSCFESILYYYQSNGRLRRPDLIPLDTFIEEVSFFQLGDKAIDQINKFENISIVKTIDLPSFVWRRYIWFYLECPQHSRLSKIIFFISMLLTIICSVCLAIESLPYFNELYSNCQINSTNNESSISSSFCPNYFSSSFFVIQTICISYFTIEFILRLLTTPSYMKFILSILNWIDLLTIIPYFVLLGLTLAKNNLSLNDHALGGLRLLRSLRFLRVFKIHLIFKEFKSFRVLSSTLKESFVDFIMLIIILTLLAFLFGAGIYFAEQHENPFVFDSIPKSTYWGLITITSVGYGDMYPITCIGKILACLCALVGTTTVGMLLSVLIDRYQRIHSRKRYFAEHIVSSIDRTDSEHDQKENFIRKKLSGLKINTIERNNFLSKESNLTIEENFNLPSSTEINSNVRFIVSFNDQKLNKKLLNKHFQDLIEQLNETIKQSEQNLQIQFVSE